MAWRLCATVGAYLFISLAYSLVSLAFQIPFWPGPGPETDAAPSATAYGRGSFPVYWMVNFGRQLSGVSLCFPFPVARIEKLLLSPLVGRRSPSCRVEFR